MIVFTRAVFHNHLMRPKMFLQNNYILQTNLLGMFNTEYNYSFYKNLDKHQLFVEEENSLSFNILLANFSINTKVYLYSLHMFFDSNVIDAYIARTEVVPNEEFPQQNKTS